MKESKFEFSNPTLEELEFYINNDFDEDNFNGIEMKSITRIDKSVKNNNAVVIFQLYIGEKSERVPFYIYVSMKAEFKWASEIEKNVNKLLKTNAPSLILSYIRPIVTNITLNSEYPAFNIPFINMQENDAYINEV